MSPSPLLVLGISAALSGASLWEGTLVDERPEHPAPVDRRS